jgi:hypothetical protein
MRVTLLLVERSIYKFFRSGFEVRWKEGLRGRRVEVYLDSDLEQREPVHLGLFNSTSKHHISF